MEEPYIIEEIVIKKKRYNPNYGNDKVCECSHTYDRHFDGYENMKAVGCKYCECDEFKPQPDFRELVCRDIDKIKSKTSGDSYIWNRKFNENIGFIDVNYRELSDKDLLDFYEAIIRFYYTQH